MDVTLFELHFNDAEFNAPFAGGRTSGDGEPTDDGSGAARESGGKVGPLAVLGVITGLALVARYLRGGEAEQSTLDEVEA